MGICRLCLKEEKLCNSHILPEFFYLDLYEEKHRTLQITKENEKFSQKGIREYLLCQESETKLSKYEKYAKELIQEFPNFSRDDDLGILFSNDVNYHKFKVFQLSILWRAGISSHDAFEQVDLGPKHEEKLRKLLEEENPGELTDYGCLVSIMFDTELLHKVIQSPTKFKKKFYDRTAYKFVTGNLTWVFVISNKKISPKIQELFLQESGVLRVMIARCNEYEEIIKLGKILHEFKRGI